MDKEGLKNMQNCPNCKQATITWRQKYLAAKWKTIHCSACGRRLCAQPIIQAVFSMLYVWDVMLFGYLTVLGDNYWYLLAMLVGWLLLDSFSIYIPLSVLRAESRK